MSRLRVWIIFVSVSLSLGFTSSLWVTAGGEPNKKQLPRGAGIAWDTIVENDLKPLVAVTNGQERDFSLVERMKHYNVPGVSIALIHGGKLAWVGGYGIADMETGKPVDTETLFRAASISKPVSALAALRLVDRGILHLDTAIDRQLTSWQIPDNKFTGHRAMTLRHLLSHSAGLSDDPNLSYPDDQALPTLIQVLDGSGRARSAPVRVDTVPGIMCRYSNQGYCILQLLMSDATGKQFPALMNELIFGPLGMTGSTFDQQLPMRLMRRAAAGYRATGEELPGKHLVCPAMAAAGLWSTPADLARLTLSIMSALAGKEGELLSKERAEEMLTIQLGDYGLGFELEGAGDSLCFSHSGASDGYRCIMLAFPTCGEGAVIMTNSDAGQGLYLEILRGLASVLSWPSYQLVEKTVVLLEQDRMAEFEGIYLLGGSLELIFSVENDHLRMDSPANSYLLFPEGDTKFFEIDYGFTVDFMYGDDGVVLEAELNRGGVISILTKIQ